MIEIDEDHLEEEVNTGLLSQRLETQLVDGYEQIARTGERLPLPSYYASRITEIIHRNLTRPISKELAFDLYQEVLLACERARARVLGEEEPTRPS